MTEPFCIEIFCVRNKVPHPLVNRGFGTTNKNRVKRYRKDLPRKKGINSGGVEILPAELMKRSGLKTNGSPQMSASIMRESRLGRITASPGTLRGQTGD